MLDSTHVTGTNPTPSRPPVYHGGAFWQAIGHDFNDLGRAHDVVNADVLDAWFPPAPTVLEALREHASWLARTSPPVFGEGLVETIAATRGVDADRLVLGAGSSALIFTALRELLNPADRVVLPQPTYGEYAHVLEQVIGCAVTRVTGSPEDNWRIDPDALATAAVGAALVVLVNPNSPTGTRLTRAEVTALLERLPRRTLLWVDEAYVDYLGEGASVETLLPRYPNLIVCKTMSKVYALSGMRAAYLAAAPALAARLRRVTPPWAIGLSAQLAARRALGAPAYYAARHAETSVLRSALVGRLRALPVGSVQEGCANFVMLRLDPAGPDAGEICARCARAGVFLRDAQSMGACLGTHALRVAVKPDRDQLRIVATLASALSRP